MDFNFILNVLILIALIYYAVNKSKFKGSRGELEVNKKLQKLDQDEYIILNDLLLKRNGKTSQIDHVVISNYGIFVIETKNLKGWIFGSEKQRNWTQTIYNNKYRIYNPILQNASHIRTIQHHLPDSPHIRYFSIIALNNSAEFKTPEQVSTPVLYYHQIINYISNQKHVCMGRLAMEQIAEKLTKSSFDDKETRKKHINNVRIAKSRKYK